MALEHKTPRISNYSNTSQYFRVLNCARAQNFSHYSFAFQYSVVLLGEGRPASGVAVLG